jgi:5-methylcytosine-specific restriction protein A
VKSKQVNPFYRSKQWEALRTTALRRDNYTCTKCGVLCLGKKKKSPSPNVDHILPISKRPDLKLNLDNLRTLCSSCHSRLTISDNHGRNKPQISEDGYPIDSA